jgi:hypothetical protein
MSQEVQGSLVTLWVSTSQNTGFKTIVCEDSSQASTTSNVNTTKTKCGTFTAVDTPETTLSGSGIVDGSPAANQATFKDIESWCRNKTKLYFIYQNIADAGTSLAKGAAVYMDGQGYFTEATVTAAEGDLVKFNWSFATSGTIDNSADS